MKTIPIRQKTGRPQAGRTGGRMVGVRSPLRLPFLVPPGQGGIPPFSPVSIILQPGGTNAVPASSQNKSIEHHRHPTRAADQWHAPPRRPPVFCTGSRVAGKNGTARVRWIMRLLDFDRSQKPFRTAT